MVRKYSPEEKHNTRGTVSVSDFVKHDCPAAKVEVWEKGQKVTKSISQKKEFSAIKGNESMIAINARASDECPYCHADITDQSMTPCTDEDVEALSK